MNEVSLEVGGRPLVLRAFPDPSGVRGQVSRCEAKIASVRIYHSTDVEALMREGEDCWTVSRLHRNIPPVGTP